MKVVAKSNFGLRAMRTGLTVDGDIAAEIADFALEKVGHQVPGFGPADVIAHLCGATAGILLGSLPPDQAIKSAEGWRLLLIEAIKQLAAQPNADQMGE